MEVSGQLHVPATGERAIVVHWIGGWVEPRARMNAVENRKVSFPCGESNSNSSAIQLKTRGCTKWAEVI
jgi:hypothetical protein